MTCVDCKLLEKYDLSYKRYFPLPIEVSRDLVGDFAVKLGINLENYAEGESGGGLG